VGINRLTTLALLPVEWTRRRTGAAKEMSMGTRTALQKLALSAVRLAPAIALAVPPPWAPAHGWRRKHDPYYAGYSGRQYDRDFGISRGSCNRDEIGAVLGGIAGGVIGSEVGKGDNRPVAIVLGTVVGAVIGAQIGRRMDERDRSCVGQALELASANQAVSWSNPQTRVAYQLTPLGANERRDDGCRAFKLVAKGTFGVSEGRTTACVDEGGVWRLSPGVKVGRR
jgi:surface antigen